MADHPDDVASTIVRVTPGDWFNWRFVRLPVYPLCSKKYASSAVERLRKSVFSDAAFALPFVFWNFGIAIAARIPMITTTISSSIRVNPRRLAVILDGLGSGALG